MSFKILKHAKKTKARIGKLETKSGGVITPVFLPIGTYGAIKNLSPEELNNLGAQIILSNTYHLWLRPGIDIIKKIGLHKFMNWKGPILTDSGGFQVFSLAKHRKLTEEGVEFKDPLNGENKILTPEKSIQIQLDLGSDIILVFDDCPPYPASHEQAKKSMEMSLRWAVRCKEYFAAQIKKEKRKSQKYNSKLKIKNLSIESKFKIQNSKLNRPLIFGIIQGSIYKDLRQESAKRIVEMGFDGFAIGGVSVGEPRQYVWKVLEWVMPLLPENKPKHLLGVGKPEEIIKAIGSGVDMFDCVIPTREARHGRIYKFKIKNEKLPARQSLRFRPMAGGKISIKKAKQFYEILNITNQKFKKDFKVIDENCGCYACKNYSRAYLNHLFKMKELLGYRLATIHNLHFYMRIAEKASEF